MSILFDGHMGWIWLMFFIFTSAGIYVSAEDRKDERERRRREFPNNETFWREYDR